MTDWEIVKQVGNYAAVVCPDELGINPRTEFDHPCTMHFSLRNYDLGDEHEYEPDSIEDLIEVLTERHGEILWRPVSAYIHSGISIWIGDPVNPFDLQGWDTGLLGIIYITREQVLKEMNLKRMTKKARKWAYDYMEGEVEEYNCYLTGDAWGIGLAELDEDGEIIDVDDTCWGFFGKRWAIEEATNQLEYHIHSQEEDKWEKVQTMEVQYGVE